MNEIDFLWELKRYISEKYGTRTEAAKRWNVSTAFVSGVTTGQKRPPNWLLDEMGYRRDRHVTISYRKVEK